MPRQTTTTFLTTVAYAPTLANRPVLGAFVLVVRARRGGRAFDLKIPTDGHRKVRLIQPPH